MGRPAARDLDGHICPMTYPGPHEGGEVLVANQRTVLVGGRPAAVLVDPVICPGWPNLIIMGSPTVLMDGFPAARKYDLTSHAGMILQGEPTVRLGTDSQAELLMLALARIRMSEYGKTEDGQKTIAILEEKLANGTLGFGELPPEKDGIYKDGVITINDDDPDDVDRVASTMVHEAKHTQPAGELLAHEEQSKFYEEQRNLGYENPGHEKILEAIEADQAKPDQLERDEKEFLRRELERRKYPSNNL